VSRRGNRRGNTRAETFFKTLKREPETSRVGLSAVDVGQSVFVDIKAYYNRIRMHPALDYVASDVFNSGQVA
jgi:transposase InsO family protein